MRATNPTLRAATTLALALPLLAAGPALAQDDDWAEQDAWADEGDAWGDEASAAPAVQIHGFGELGVGSRVVGDDTTEDQLVLSEALFRLELDHESELASLSFKGDLLADGVEDEVIVDIREASATLSPAHWLTITAGRQVLTWGTGDLVFLNDLFPKDFVSFFIGRDDEYLKAPSTALKTSFYFYEIFNLDLVWTPVFEPDRFISGERLSFFSPMAGQRVGGGVMVDPVEPELDLDNGEFAARLYRNIGGHELALYGYYGFWKQPSALDTSTDPPRPTFSRLAVYGASWRAPLLGGIANMEGSFYHSLDDEDGDDPTVPNSQVRGLVGYEHELITKMTLGLQYYVEYILDHDAMLDSMQSTVFAPDELRHVVTSRITWMLLRDDLTLSLFAMYSPSDMDAYIRPSIGYKVTDAVELTVGGNVLVGEDDHTFFSQLEDNSNAYGRIRYTF
ncbi:MAG: hypothetical protein ACQEXJ_18065 [Myxococcota bacterium]